MRNRIALLALAALFPLLAQAQVSISEPWVRATTSQQKATGAFMKLEASRPMALVGARSPVAGVVEVHEMATETGVMKMRAIPKLALPAGKVTELRPGSYHIMLMDLKAPLTAGEKVAVTLLLEDEQQQRHEQTVTAEVRPLNAGAPAHQHQHGRH